MNDHVAILRQLVTLYPAPEFTAERAALDAAIRALSAESGFRGLDLQGSPVYGMHPYAISTTTNHTAATTPTAPPVAVDGWQPIETAPKDRAIFAWNGDYLTIATWNNTLGDWVDQCELSGFPGFSDYPTHWQPLPAAPASKEAS